MRTRLEEQVLLEERGVTGAALELLLRLGAEARHRHRVEATIDTALRFIDGPPQHIPQNAANALVLCLADQLGIGGRFGMGDAAYGGNSTLRLPCFRTLGKGRKQATDGAAYMAALDGAIDGLKAFAVGDRYASTRWAVRAETAFLVVSSPSFEIESRDIRTLLPYEWQAPIAARELAYHARTEDGCGAIPEYLPVWGAIYNVACDPAAAMRRAARAALLAHPEQTLSAGDAPAGACATGVREFIARFGLGEPVRFDALAAHPRLEEMLVEDKFVEAILSKPGDGADSVGRL